MQRQISHPEQNESVMDPELSLYRTYTVAMLRRYFRMSIELGRLPSILGREFFRAKVTSYRMHSFEDVVILVHDVERCLEQLDSLSQQLIARVVLQEHTHDEAAEVMGCTRRTVIRRMPEALDKLSEIFLHAGILRRLPNPRAAEIAAEPDIPASPATVVAVKKIAPQTCQEGEGEQFAASA